MLGGLMRRIVGDANEKALDQLQPIVDAVNAFDQPFRALSDDELAERTPALRARLAAGESLDDILPEAIATAREAIARTVGERAYEVQVQGAIVLHRGSIAEMKTGEGKTLVATLALYAHALEGQGAHLVTVNDYLARREPQWYGPALDLLGITLGVLQHDQPYVFSSEPQSEAPGMEYLRAVSRQEAYAADITYGTNNEFGFDYLRDNMATSAAKKVQRGQHFAIVDECDSVLIDEARTPLIISGQQQEDLSVYPRFAQLVPSLEAETHYTIEERHRSVHLTEAGIEALEVGLGVDNIFSPENFRLTRYMEAALKAQIIYQRDHDYVVSEGKVVIVDDFTGRLMEGRRWSDGLHQAVEAKEGVQIQQESVTYATITLQNYFRMYETLAGMTGTAATEAEELSEIYDLDVYVMPTNRALQREDRPDFVYRSLNGKFKAVVDEVAVQHEAGRPVLVGTVSIETSELLSEMLMRRGVEHEVLNAKHHQREASIVAKAGQYGAVTIATNMAGRGTDIKLGEGVADLGGLQIIGTERHESRRVDNQLRGRSGRQGDPGATRFFVSFEDDLMRRFAPDWLPGMMDRLGMDEGEALESRMVTRAIEQAQGKVEAYHFDLRKHVVEYDDVMNTHRNVIYTERDKVLDGEDLRDTIVDMARHEFERLVGEFLDVPREPELFRAQLGMVFDLEDDEYTPEAIGDRPAEELLDELIEKFEDAYDALEDTLGDDVATLVERSVLLRSIDSLWVQHLTAMHELRQGIGLRAYGQGNPLIHYKRESHDMWDQFLSNVRSSVTRQLLHAQVVDTAKLRAESPAVPRGLNESGPSEPGSDAAGIDVGGDPAAAGSGGAGSGGGVATAVGSAGAATETVPKVGRNQPCPCDSGKKYKRCHGRVA